MICLFSASTWLEVNRDDNAENTMLLLVQYTVYNSTSFERRTKHGCIFSGLSSIHTVCTRVPSTRVTHKDAIAFMRTVWAPESAG